jgi:hypothetical protein
MLEFLRRLFHIRTVPSASGGPLRAVVAGECPLNEGWRQSEENFQHLVAGVRSQQ